MLFTDKKFWIKSTTTTTKNDILESFMIGSLFEKLTSPFLHFFSVVPFVSRFFIFRAYRHPQTARLIIYLPNGGKSIWNVRYFFLSILFIFFNFHVCAVTHSSWFSDFVCYAVHFCRSKYKVNNLTYDRVHKTITIFSVLFCDFSLLFSLTFYNVA